MYTTNKFSLCMLNLIMQAAERSLYRLRVVILDKVNLFTDSKFKLSMIKALKKETALIFKYFRFDNKYIINICFNRLHFLSYSS